MILETQNKTPEIEISKWLILFKEWKEKKNENGTVELIPNNKERDRRKQDTNM